MGAMLDAAWNGAVFAPPTRVDIASIEAAILGQLRALITGIEIAHYPDRPESWRMTHRVGAALVMYKGAEYGGLLDTAAVIQERKLEFEIALLMRDLGWSVGGATAGPSPGAYAMIESIRNALTGFRAPGCGKMHPVREKFVERDKQGGVWSYALTFHLTTPAVEASTTENFPLFVRGLAMEEGGETSIAVGAASYTFDSNGRVTLANGNVFAVSVIAQGGVARRLGVDFTVDRVNGIVAAMSGGAIAPGETVQIAYQRGEVAIATAGQNAPTN
ncbi:MAG TPA: Gp37 family protein [Candidatus Acidoferrales bacterium]|nr:Gp37 family protein [Candidatus Acidoferrales bacterium]